MDFERVRCPRRDLLYALFSNHMAYRSPCADTFEMGVFTIDKH